MKMTAAVTPGIIATIVVILIIATILIVFYFVCRSDDPARDHTCVAMLYPQSRRELRQLRIPLDPINATNEYQNPGFVDEKVKEKEPTGNHEVQMHRSTTTQSKETNATETIAQTGNISQQQGFVTLSLHSLASSQAE